MLAFCGHTWWKKPENPGKTTDLGRATTTLPHADTEIRSRVAAVASECTNHCAIQALSWIEHEKSFITSGASCCTGQQLLYRKNYQNWCTSFLQTQGCFHLKWPLCWPSYCAILKQLPFEPCCEKTGLRGFRQGPIQTRLCSLRRWLEAWNFVFRKKRDCTIRVVKTKALISFTVTAKLICVFVFAYTKIWFSHVAAHFTQFSLNLAYIGTSSMMILPCCVLEQDTYTSRANMTRHDSKRLTKTRKSCVILLNESKQWFLSQSLNTMVKKGFNQFWRLANFRFRGLRHLEHCIWQLKRDFN